MMIEVALVLKLAKKVFGDLVSKSVNDSVDIIKDKIKDADYNRKFYNQNLQTQIYHVTIDALNKFTCNKYEKQDKLYDAAENILKNFICTNDNTDAVKSGLKILISDVNNNICQEFLEILYSEICKDDNSNLYKEIDMLWKRRECEYIHGELEKNNQYNREILGELNDLKEVLNFIRENIYNQERIKADYCKIPIENRAEEYTSKWNKNVFLNDFNKRDKNAGVNIKLREIYLEEHLPHYVWKTDNEPLSDLKELLSEYIVDNDDKKMLLILGQAGIGKSTLITWIMANLVEKKDNILVYQFANDLWSVNWQGENILNDILNDIGLEYDELENKTLILDGFDEIYVGSEREGILNKLNQELKRRNSLKIFSLIITCRENYIYNLQNVKFDYIVLQAWDERQIRIFSRTYWEKCGNRISDDKIQRILENREIFGIPLILYMILALDVDIERGSSKMDIYDQVFSLKRGGIYDRCYDTEHRINSSEIKKHIHRISQKIAFWIFENNADKVYISQKSFKEICENEMNESVVRSEEIQNDALIGNFFKLKHCEGKGTDELQFVHRSIYEYFVVIYFFESIHKLKTKEEVAGKLGELLKDGLLSEQILEFIKYKFDSIKKYSLSNVTREIFNIMLKNGMTFYTKERYKNIIEQERNVFSNMLEIVGLWNPMLGEVNDKIIIYLQCNSGYRLNLKGIDLSGKKYDKEKLDLRGVNLRGANLIGADLRGVDLEGADLNGTNLSRADLRGVNLRGTNLKGANLKGADLGEACLARADLIGADLNGADLRGADLNETDLRCAYLVETDLRGAYLIKADLGRTDLSKAYLSEMDLEWKDLDEAEYGRAYLNKEYLSEGVLLDANLEGTLFNEQQVKILYRKYNLNMSDILLSETDERISYQEYNVSKQKE